MLRAGPQLTDLMTTTDHTNSKSLITTADNRGAFHKLLAAQTRVFKGIVQPIPYGLGGFLFRKSTAHSLPHISTASKPGNEESIHTQKKTSQESSRAGSPTSPTSHHKPELQTKHIKIITRQDIINGKYDLDPSTDKGEKDSNKLHKRKKSHRRTLGKRSSSSPHSQTHSHSLSQSPRLQHPETLNVTNDIADDDTITTTQPYEPYEPEVNHTGLISRHTFNGRVDDSILLTIPLQRHITRESELSASTTGNW